MLHNATKAQCRTALGHFDSSRVPSLLPPAVWHNTVPARYQRCIRCRSSAGTEGVPDELQGLRVNDAGDLVDERTGEVINVMGVTRFDLAVKAIRGDFDAGVPAEQNTERSEGLILDSLLDFPAAYTFQAVAKGWPDGDAFLQSVRGTISRVCGADIPGSSCAVKARMAGKYWSARVTAQVQSAEMIGAVYEALAEDERIVMKF